MVNSISGSISGINNIRGEISQKKTISGGVAVPERVGANDYNKLSNKPQIEGNELIGNKTYPELGLGDITPQEIDNILFGGF